MDVRSIQRKVGMSQARFAASFALNPRTLQEWEQGKAHPDGAVRAYLTVIERNPVALVDALREPIARKVKSPPDHPTVMLPLPHPLQNPAHLINV